MGECHTPVCEALVILKSQQDQLEGCPTDCFSSLLAKLLKVDTIPFMLYTPNGGPLELAGFEHEQYTICTKYFHTRFFRIESIDKENCCAKISLLRPVDLEGYSATSICEVAYLERTKICTVVDLNCFCAVQCLDVELMRKIIIEPKW
ncbi:CotY/CotZ family spore coat protein [Bacillus salitolerans]|uniref:CotY/CotZ family spore coat protein n=1 Tax=Bacillus salitolerans TaxID=1437434 RepID=A0ABW4LJU4_9BACI